ncbi:amino acid ABC transporter permease [Parvibaculum sp.]|uniref:amino acid ABC transporter permease n=1 Tax=Parvibaculum sp. TaxID=2024848 RepID=UPI00320E626E
MRWSWNDPHLRALVWQIAALAAVIFMLWYFAATAHANLARQHIATGFGFLDSTAGFGIVQALIPYSEEASYGRAFLVGLCNTLLVAALGTMLAVALGFAVGIARLSSNWLVAKLAAVYVETLRNIPLLLQLFFWYFAILQPLPGPRESLTLLPGVFLSNRGVVMPGVGLTGTSVSFLAVLFLAIVASFLVARYAKARRMATGERFPAGIVNIVSIIALPGLVWLIGGAPFTIEHAAMGKFDFTGGWRLLPEFLALLLGLALYTAAFIAEIVRAGIQSVGRGQTEAAHALGLSNWQTLRLVVIPQALRVIIPPLTSQILNLTKNSSLAVAIGYPDLVSVFAGTVLNQTGQAIEVIAITMGVYLVISLATSLAMNLYNARVAIVER